jgi:hypothetical protein
MRVTDLEKFSLEQIWWPFQTLAGLSKARLTSTPYSLDETAQILSEDSQWSECVLGRLSRIKPDFPAYIVHPLVDVVRAATAEVAALSPLDGAASEGESR